MMRAAWLSLLLGLPVAAENYGDWTQSRDVILNTSPSGADVASDQIGFPVLVALGSQDAALFAEANAAGSDLRFAKSGGGHLPYQIESWDPAGSKAAIWVRVDTLKGGAADQRIKMYWGKAGAPDSSDGKAVFRKQDGFQGVWHLGGDLKDATVNGYNGLDSGATAEPAGRIGGARYFNNPDAYAAQGKYISLGNPAGLNLAGRITFEVWAKWIRRDGHRIIICHGGAPGNDFETVLRIGEYLDYRTGVWTSTGHHATVIAAPADSNVWVHLAGVYTGANWILYRNGRNAAATAADTNGAKPSPASWRIGAAYAGGKVNRFFHGWLDEVRLSDMARSADWIKLSYENQKPGQSLVTFAPTTGVRAAGPFFRASQPRSRFDGTWLFLPPDHSGPGISAKGERRRPLLPAVP
jgi:hypothetical protein